MPSIVRRVAVGTGVVALLFLLGCGRQVAGFLGGGGGAGGQGCTLSIGPNSEDIPLTVRYSASVSGDVEIRVLRYETNEGTQTQKSLKKSWSKTVNVDSGTDVKMSATVRLFGGETKISFTGRDSSGTRVMGEQDLCSMN